MSGGLGGGGILAVGDYVYQSEYEVIELLGGGNSGEVYRIWCRLVHWVRPSRLISSGRPGS